MIADQENTLPPTPQRASPEMLLQRVRQHLIDYLEVASSLEAQLAFQAKSPELDVAREMIEQWADWVSPDWQSELVAPVFSKQEIAAIAQFQSTWLQISAALPQPLLPLAQMLATDLWDELRAAAKAAWQVFQERT